MHRLVARVIRDRHRAEDDYPALISTTVRMLGTAVFSEALAWQRREDGDQLIAQIDTLWEHSDITAWPSPAPLPDKLGEQLVWLRIWSVRQLTRSANLDRAITLAGTVRTDCQRLLGDEHPDTLTAVNDLASAYLAAGWLEQAIPLFEQTLTDSRRLLGDEHPFS
jgi:Tetratricopeptide repeat